MEKHISYEDIGFDENMIDCSETPEFGIPIGMSDQGVYYLTFKSGFMYRSEAMSSYMISGYGLEDKIILQSILLNGCKRHAPSNLKFWIYHQKNDRFVKFADCGFSHVERFITLSDNDQNCIDFWKDLAHIADQRFEMLGRFSKQDKNCIFEIGQYNQEMIAQNKPEQVLPRIIVLVNMDGVFSKSSLDNRLLESIEPYFCQLTHAAKQGIHLVFTANEGFYRNMPHALKITNQVINGICTRGKGFFKDTVFGDVFDDKMAEKLAFNECIIATGELYFGNCKFKNVQKVTIASCSDDDLYQYISRIKNQIKNP